MCCSRSDCLHLESKPLSFQKGPNSRDTDSNLLNMDCEMIKNGIGDILNQEEFYMDAWKEHFNMEKKILQEEFKNKSFQLMLAEDRENGQQKRYHSERCRGLLREDPPSVGPYCRQISGQNLRKKVPYNILVLFNTNFELKAFYNEFVF